MQVFEYNGTNRGNFQFSIEFPYVLDDEILEQMLFVVQYFGGREAKIVETSKGLEHPSVEFPELGLVTPFTVTFESTNPVPYQDLMRKFDIFNLPIAHTKWSSSNGDQLTVSFEEDQIAGTVESGKSPEYIKGPIAKAFYTSPASDQMIETAKEASKESNIEIQADLFSFLRK